MRNVFITVASLIIFALLLVLIFYLFKKWKENKDKTKNNINNNQIDPIIQIPLTDRIKIDNEIDSLVNTLKLAYNNKSNIEQSYDDFFDRITPILDLTIKNGYENNLSGSNGALRIVPIDDKYANILATRILNISNLITDNNLKNFFNSYELDTNYLLPDETNFETIINHLKIVYIYKLLKRFGYTYIRVNDNNYKLTFKK
jgi:hypothetical protein